MKRRIYVAALGLLLAVGIGVAGPVVGTAAASPQSVVCGTLGAGGGCGSTPSNGINLNNAVAGIVNILSVVVGVAAVIMIIIAGLRFITANGDSNHIASARSTIIYALVGLAVVALAQTIVKFVLDKITR
jgi:cytochrome bd-type quinol oxidase subunit 2